MHDALIVAGFFLMVLSPCLVGLHAANSEVSLWVALRRFGMRRRVGMSRRISSVRGRAGQAIYRVVALGRHTPSRQTPSRNTTRPASWSFRMPQVFSHGRVGLNLRRLQSVLRFARLGLQMSSRGRRLSNLSARH